MGCLTNIQKYAHFFVSDTEIRSFFCIYPNNLLHSQNSTLNKPPGTLITIHLSKVLYKGYLIVHKYVLSSSYEPS